MAGKRRGKHGGGKGREGRLRRLSLWLRRHKDLLRAALSAALAAPRGPMAVIIAILAALSGKGKGKE